MLNEKNVGFIGAGQMCEAILGGALEAGVLMPGKVWATDVSGDRLTSLQKRYGIQTVLNTGGDNGGAKQLAERCDVVILAIKPQIAPELLQQVGPAFEPRTLVLSIMAGVTLATLEAAIPAASIIRVMPNTPMLVRKGCAGLAAGRGAGEAELALCRELFDAVGESFVLPERLIDPLTAVSGCGPAFACLFMEALADGGVEQGLPRDVAMQLAARTLAGTAELLLQTGSHPAVLKDNVCSPGGSTIVGVHTLENGGLRAAVMDAVRASCARNKELG